MPDEKRPMRELAIKIHKDSLESIANHIKDTKKAFLEGASKGISPNFDETSYMKGCSDSLEVIVLHIRMCADLL